ncbi:MAG: transposase [Chloroflexi bacterium]|nr:transposase [Chloroflexota bacterium]
MQTKRFITRPRMAGFDYRARQLYHLVLVTHAREPVLLDDLAARVVGHLEKVSDACAFEVLAYTLMPDHLHLLLKGTTEDSDAVKFVQQFKQRTSYEHIQKTGERLWQPSFYDHAVRKTERAEQIARYILENPYRAGLIPFGERWAYQGGTLMAEL